MLGHHPDRTLVPAVEIGSGSLGHGLGLAVGTALGQRIAGRDVRTVVLVGDAELDEGSNAEAIQYAGRAGLDRLMAVVVDNASASQGWPGLFMTRVTRMNHIGLPVSDLERSVQWYRDVLGVTPTGVTIAADNPGIGAVVEVEGAAMRAEFALAGDNILLELIQYDRPEPQPFSGRNCDVGVMHLCFEVASIDTAYAELRERGVHVSSEPVTLADGDGVHAGQLAGTKILYLRDPDGIQLELFELPI